MLAPYQFGSSNSALRVARPPDRVRRRRGHRRLQGRAGPRAGRGALVRRAKTTARPTKPSSSTRPCARTCSATGPAIGQNIANDRTPGQLVEAETPQACRRRRRGVSRGRRVRRRAQLRALPQDDGGTAARPTRGQRHRDRPPRNLLIKVRPGTTAEFEERLIKRLQAAAPSWSFEVSTLSSMRDSSIRFADGAAGGRRPGRRLPDADGGAWPAGRALAERHAAHARDGPAPRQGRGQGRRAAADPRRDRA